MTHCGMVPNGVRDLIEFQLTSLCRIEVLACSFDTDFNSAHFDNNLCNKGDGKCHDPSIFLDFTVFKGINFASLNSV